MSFLGGFLGAALGSAGSASRSVDEQDSNYIPIYISVFDVDVIVRGVFSTKLELSAPLETLISISTIRKIYPLQTYAGENLVDHKLTLTCIETSSGRHLTKDSLVEVKNKIKLALKEGNEK